MLAGQHDGNSHRRVPSDPPATLPHVQAATQHKSNHHPLLFSAVHNLDKGSPTTLFKRRLLLNEPWPQSCPTTKSAQNIVPCASQYAGHTRGLLMARAPAARPATAITSLARYESERRASFLKHFSGMARRISARVNGGVAA